MDVVYTLNDESRCNDLELKYSLRSLSRLTDIDKVWIIGKKPKWIQNCEFIPAQDPYLANKDANLISKLLLACNEEKVAEQFLWFSDDQVLLKEVSIRDFLRPIIDNTYLDKIAVASRLNRWQQRLQRTVKLLKSKGLQHDCYESHSPYLIYKCEYPRIMLSYDYGCDIGYCSNTLYFNTRREVFPDTPIANINDYHKVLKVETEAPSFEFIHDLAIDKTFLNYSDAAINENLFLYLESLYPFKSKYEQ
jgi:hypothetical protein